MKPIKRMKNFRTRTDPVSLEDAKAEFKKGRDGKGAFCPCCGKFGKLYKRRFNSGLARSLIWLVRTHAENPGWVNVPATAPRYVTGSREFGKLEHWGVARSADNTDKSKRCSGLWMPTQDGIDFVHGKCVVPKHMWEYDNTVEFWSEETSDIREALGAKFNYEELMARPLKD